jgi:flagellar assembly protein FliH
MPAEGSRFRRFPNGDVEKWDIPPVDSTRSRVFHNENRQGGDETGEEIPIPTAQDIEQWRQQARDEGYREGRQQAEQETAQLRKQLLQLIEFFDRPLQALNDEVEQQLALLAVTLAQQLVRREIRADPGALVGVIREAAQLLPANARKIRISLNPEDAELVRNTLQLDEHDDEQSWKLVEDPLVTRGGCVIKADQSVINATLENRLQALAASVLGGDRVEDQVERNAD